MKCYIGTYTRTDSKGIYEIEFDTGTGEIRETGRTYRMYNPTYLLHEGDKIYAIGENDGKPIVVMLTDEFKFVSSVESSGKGFCHLCCNNKLYEEKRYLVAASYHGGYFSVYKMQGEYLKEKLYDVDLGEKSHCHYAAFYEGCLLVVDLGLDKILAYDFDFETGEIKLNNELTYSADKGDGPRHLMINGRIIYLLNELSSTIHVLEFEDGRLVCKQKIATLPEAYDGNTCAAIKMTRNGKFLYASNRGHDSIVGYKVLNDGLLEIISFTASGGKHPRDFEIAPGDDFLLVANMDTDNIVSFKIEQETGELLETGFEILIPQPVCVKF